ncbi:spermatogenesis-defective protein 39 homolog isoform X1 [Scyliorhinus canicula]|uniref:spermatogenesis-defective protein 39 homolog isoform X1 n=1 Tax=Scyliorhinus canicula TaxID=7830 RepID=UPI0018F58892|nr:spermatogenesis-defective protein 39 homolog isoform X1 [Scyliorhinus canicula]XP_038629867.1 spermatogenesis-defective protein 39 homolog isoform X1 [Scyliorhinus canicula]
MSRTKNDEEDYWNSTKCKAFAFDDDDEFTELKESKRAVNSIRSIVDDDDDDVEKVSWSGEPVGSISWSIKESATGIRAGEVRDVGPAKSPSDTAQASLSKPISAYSLSSFFKGKRDPSSVLFGISRPGSFQSLSDSVVGSSTTNYAPNLRRSKADYKDISIDWSPSETVRQMQKGKMYSLERFRSLNDKLHLVDEAVRTHDGNVITAVLIFLKKSLSKEILFRELEYRPVALQHFVYYLKETEEQKLLLEMLKVLGRTEEAALLQYKDHLSIKSQVKKTEYLKNCTGLPFAYDDATFVRDHYTLLDRQIIIEENDKRIEASGQMEVFRKHPRKASILHMPLVTTLYYSCFYHYGESEGTFSSPANLKTTFKISDKQYLLTTLAARAKLKAWKDVDTLFTTKNWLGYTKKKAPIGFHRVVDILHKNNAPVEVIQEYVALVDSTELKLNLATKYKCHNIVIDTYRDLKDRQQLVQYRDKLETNSQEHRKIDYILSNSQIRWKN